MIIVTLSSGKKGRAIILDEPSAEPTSGVVECPLCGCRAFLYSAESKALAGEIEEFIASHDCLKHPVGKEELLGQLVKEHRKLKGQKEGG